MVIPIVVLYLTFKLILKTNCVQNLSQEQLVNDQILLWQSNQYGCSHSPVAEGGMYNCPTQAFLREIWSRSVSPVKKKCHCEDFLGVKTNSRFTGPFIPLTFQLVKRTVGPLGVLLLPMLLISQ